MRNYILTAMFLISSIVYCQSSLKKDFIRDLNNNELVEGCKIVVYVVDASANLACYIPEPSISKVACAAAKILNVSNSSDLDPNTPNLIHSAGQTVCQFSYVLFKSGIKYTFDFSKSQTEEIKNTWNWLNTLEGAVFMLEYLKR